MVRSGATRAGLEAPLAQSCTRAPAHPQGCTPTSRLPTVSVAEGSSDTTRSCWLPACAMAGLGVEMALPQLPPPPAAGAAAVTARRPARVLRLWRVVCHRGGPLSGCWRPEAALARLWRGANWSRANGSSPGCYTQVVVQACCAPAPGGVESSPCMPILVVAPDRPCMALPVNSRNSATFCTFVFHRCTVRQWWSGWCPSPAPCGPQAGPH